MKEEGCGRDLRPSCPYFWKTTGDSGWGVEVSYGRAGGGHATLTVPGVRGQEHRDLLTVSCHLETCGPHPPGRAARALESSSRMGEGLADHERLEDFLGRVLVDSWPGSPFRKASTTTRAGAGPFLVLSQTQHRPTCPHTEPRGPGSASYSPGPRKAHSPSLFPRCFKSLSSGQ